MEGYLWDRPAAKAAFREAARIARSARRKTAITLSDSFCVERHRDSFLELIRRDIDIVFANESEIKALYETQNFEEAMQAVARDCGLAVLTRSAAGSIAVQGSSVSSAPAYPVETVVDLTGAGDLFAAGFLFAHTREMPLSDCLHIGALAAADVISRVGARPSTRLDHKAQNAGLL
jgi:sugar/nucleoside kinase (ribokinase family)